MGSHSIYFGMHNGCMMGAAETTAMVMVVGVMNLTIGCADEGPNTGVGTVKIGRRGCKASAARHWGHLVKVLIHVKVQRHSASDGRD